MTAITTPLSRKATLVSVNISQWSARKLDRKITDEVNEAHRADKDAGRYNKLLIRKEHLAELTSLVSEARSLHYKMTQPWSDEGLRILPNMLYAKFSDEFRVLKRKFNDAADHFARNYPDYVAERKASLNGMFNDADYPAAEEIRSKFNLDFNMMQLPDVSDFRADLDEDTIDEIKAQMEATTAGIAEKAMKHTVAQILDKVGRMAERLKAYEPGERHGVFRDSLVENIRELADLLPAFNLTNDPQLTAITERIKAELCVEDAADLREHDDVRASVQKSADEIVAAVSGLFG